jgi:hypothetical protein
MNTETDCPIEFSMSEAIQHIKTLPIGTLIIAKDTVPKELWDLLKEAKLTIAFGKKLAQMVSALKINLKRASGEDKFTSSRHNQYVVTGSEI